MKILLLNPPFKASRGFNREGRCTQQADFWSTPWPPYSLASIAAVVREDHDVKILDCPAQEIGRRELVEFAAAERPDLIVASSSTPTIGSDLDVLLELKRACGAVTVTFGIHATIFAGEILARGPVDVVVRHEPEQTVKHLVEAIEGRRGLAAVQGLAFVDEQGQVVLTDRRPFIKDLDALPHPAWDLVDLNRYRLPGLGRRFLIVSTIRGCPFGCSFCNAHVYYGAGARLRSVPSLVAEIRDARGRYGIDDFFFWGDTFTLVREQVRSLCASLLQEGLRIRWVANSRVDTVDAEILGLMRRAGCWMVSYGIESGDGEILRRCGKRITPEQVVRAVRLTKAAGLKAAGHFILGLPGETEASAERTCALARRLDLDFANFYAAVPFPGSALYDEAVREGWIRQPDWERFSQSEFVMDLPTIAAARLRQIRRKAYRSNTLRLKNVGLAAEFLWRRLLGPLPKASPNPSDRS